MLNNKILELIAEFALMFPAFILIFSMRGFAKALAAKIMGDDTPAHSGYLTLNPIVHINLYSILIFVGLIFLAVGANLISFQKDFLLLVLILVGSKTTWNIPVDESNFKHYTLGVIFTTLAPALGNFLLALVFLYAANYFPFSSVPANIAISMAGIFGYVIKLALLFITFDLIPLPPFNAGRILEFILPKSMHYVIDFLYNYSIFIILALLFLPGINNIFFGFFMTLQALILKGLLFLVF